MVLRFLSILHSTLASAWLSLAISAQGRTCAGEHV